MGANGSKPFKARGRTNDEGRVVLTNVLLYPQERAMLEQIATQRGMTLTAVVRRGIELVADEHGAVADGHTPQHMAMT